MFAPAFVDFHLWFWGSVGLAVISVFGMYWLGSLFKWTDRNFLYKAIPTSVGLAFCVTATVVVAAFIFGSMVDAFFSFPKTLSPAYLSAVEISKSFILGLLGLSVLGLVDDRFGTHQVSGLLGHLHAFLKGRVTTGAIKAIVGTATCFFIGFLINPHTKTQNNQLALLLDSLLIALSANAINLLDRRPSRALKGYALGLALILLLSSREHWWLLVPITVAALVYAPLDFRCKAMMGDAGSNALGAALGMLAALDLPFTAKVIAVVLLLAFNLGSEKFSYTKIIESNRFLRWFDRLGVAYSRGGS